MLNTPCDLPTIKNAIRKRIDGLNPAVRSTEKISTQDIRVRFEPTLIKIILCVDIDSVPYVLPAELPDTTHVVPYYVTRPDMGHGDLLNLVDRMAEDVKLVAAIQRRQKAITGEDAPMSQAELDARIARAAAQSPFGVIT